VFAAGAPGDTFLSAALATSTLAPTAEKAGYFAASTAKVAITSFTGTADTSINLAQGLLGTIFSEASTEYLNAKLLEHTHKVK
jgi:hypothetical protein